MKGVLLAHIYRGYFEKLKYIYDKYFVNGIMEFFTCIKDIVFACIYESCLMLKCCALIIM